MGLNQQSMQFLEYYCIYTSKQSKSL